MTEQKLENLKSFIESLVNCPHSSLCNINQDFGEYLGFKLKTEESQLAIILDEIAREELKYQQINNNPPPIFSNYIRYPKEYPTHKEVFVGNKWILVPIESQVRFSLTSSSKSSFQVNINYKGNFAVFKSNETLYEYENPSYNQKLDISLENTNQEIENFSWSSFGKSSFEFVSDNTGFLDDGITLYDNLIPKKTKRFYAYKISKVTKKIGKPLKAGKVFHGTEKFMKKGGKIVGRFANILTIGSIGYELSQLDDIRDIKPHTVVDGALLIVGVTAAYVGAPVVVTGIAIYGILDYFLDISETLDQNFGRNSEIWNRKYINNYPKDRTPLFREIAIDKTAVKKRFIPKDFKN